MSTSGSISISRLLAVLAVLALPACISTTLGEGADPEPRPSYEVAEEAINEGNALGRWEGYDPERSDSGERWILRSRPATPEAPPPLEEVMQDGEVVTTPADGEGAPGVQAGAGEGGEATGGADPVRAASEDRSMGAPSSAGGTAAAAGSAGALGAGDDVSTPIGGPRDIDEVLSATGEHWADLFDGKSLAGWTVVNGAKSTWTPRDGMLVCSGKPTSVLRTDRMYENFVLELEYRHMKKGGNAGLFVWSDPLPVRGQPFTRSIEVQVMDGVNTPDYTSHGDIFSIQGASLVPDRPHPAGWERCLPSERRARPAGQWNHYRVTCLDGRITLAVNGEVVSGVSECVPRMGYLCLEAEGSEVWFRNLRLSELPPSDFLDTEHVARQDEGFRSLYNGVVLNGWKGGINQRHWTPKDWVLDYDGKGETLWTKAEYGDFELIADWRWSGEAVPTERPVIGPDGLDVVDAEGNPVTETVDDAGDSGLYLRGNEKSQVNLWCWPVGSGEVYGYRTDADQPPEVRAGVTPAEKADMPIGEWNRIHVRLVGETLTVALNGRTVIDHARLPGVPASGPIGLQHHESPIQFANIYVKEL